MQSRKQQVEAGRDVNRGRGGSIRVLTVAAIAVIAAVWLLGCVASGPPAGTPSITGSVTQASWNAQGLGTMLVEGPTQPEGAVSDKASVTITDETAFYDVDGARLTERPRISVGANVRVWFTGPVAESYPVQATALAVQYTD